MTPGSQYWLGSKSAPTPERFLCGGGTGHSLLSQHRPTNSLLSPEHFDLKFSLQLSDLSASFCGIFTKASILDGISGPFVEMKNQSSFGESLMSKI